MGMIGNLATSEVYDWIGNLARSEAYEEGVLMANNRCKK
jgi:hypothetical protein